MKSFFQSPALLTALLLFLAGSVASGAWFAHEQVEDVIHLAEVQILSQEAVLFELADRTDRNEGDAVVNAIIKDCSTREAFEDLLSTIGTLGYADLLRLEGYYDGCASFYAERKAMMVARLEREAEVLEQYNAFLAAVAPERVNTINLNDWQTLVTLERDRSDGLNDQVRIQRAIITELLSGKARTGEEITSLLQEASSVAERLEVAGAQIDTLRESLSRL